MEGLLKLGVRLKGLQILYFCSCGLCLVLPTVIGMNNVDNCFVNDSDLSVMVDKLGEYTIPRDLVPFEPRSWWDANWSKSKRIIIQHEYVDQYFSYFPVLISGIDTNLSGWTQEDGSDFIFVSADNSTVFPYELELYNYETSEVLAWVNVSNLSSVDDTILYLYYGNFNCSSQENVSGTWDEDFVGIFHMNQSEGSLVDSAGTQNAIGYENGTLYRQTGRVGYGVELGGDVDGGYFLMSHDAYLFQNDNVTVEAWVNLHRNKNSDDTIVYLGRHSSLNPGPRITLRKLKQEDHSGKIVFECGNSNENRTRVFSNLDGPVFLHRWVHTTGVVNFSGIELRLFIDGISQSPPENVWPYQLPALSVSSIGYDGMGDEQSSNWNYFDGCLDEIRISKVSRSAAWINTTFNCMNFPNSFSDFGFAFVVSIDVEGEGVVVRNPDQTAYERFALVNISAVAQTGWIFDHWAGDVTGLVNPQQIVVDDNKYIMAYFSDIQPPLLSNFTIVPTSVVENTSVSMECDVFDNSEVDVVNVLILAPNGSEYNYSMIEGDPYTFSQIFEEIGLYQCRIWASDVFGNVNTSLPLIFEVIPENVPPDGPVFPFPVNNSPYVSVYQRWLNVTVYDSDEDLMDVCFYWGNHSLIGNVSAVSNGTVASLSLPSVREPYWLEHDRHYTWYVVVNDSKSFVIGPLWGFHTSIAWDINEDRIVGAEDLSILTNYYLSTGQAGQIGADINNDGEVGAEDLSLLTIHYLEEY